MPNGGNHGDPTGGLIGWAIGVLATLFGGGAAVYQWVQRQRDRRKAQEEKAQVAAATKADREQAKVAVPFKTLFEELQAKLKTVQNGFEQLQRDHIEERVKAARFETEATLLRAEVAELRSRLEGGQA